MAVLFSWIGIGIPSFPLLGGAGIPAGALLDTVSVVLQDTLGNTLLEI